MVNHKFVHHNTLSTFLLIPHLCRSPSQDSMFFVVGHMNDAFLMRIANHPLDATEQIQLGVYLGVDTFIIREMISSPGEAVNKSLAILAAWKDDQNNVANPAAMYDQLCKAFVELNKANVVEYIRSGKFMTVIASRMCYLTK